MAEAHPLRADAPMPFPRLLSFGAALGVSLASAACDSTNAEGGSSSNSGPTPNGSDPSGATGAGGAIAALTLSSCVPASYSLPLRIGDSEPFDVVLDTGSTSIGVASSSCSRCDIEPKFSPDGDVTDEGVEARSEYVTGAWSGEVYEGPISLAAQTKASVKFVAINQQQDFFIDQTCGSKSGTVQGIMGLGPAGAALRGTTGFFDQFVAESKARDIFATSLCDDGGTLWLGGYDATRTTAAPQYTPLVPGVLTGYAVQLAAIDVEGTTVPVASPQYSNTIVDTGSSVFLLPTSAFRSVIKAIAANDKFKALIGEDATWFDNPNGQSCKKLSTTKSELDAALPPLTLTFGKGADAIAVQAAPTESYLGEYDGWWCSTLLSFDPSPDLRIASIMGAPVLRSNVVIFDRENQRLGFAPHTPCR